MNQPVKIDMALKQYFEGEIAKHETKEKTFRAAGNTAEAETCNRIVAELKKCLEAMNASKEKPDTP